MDTAAAPDFLAEVRALHERGLFLQAWRLGTGRLGALESWRGAEGLIMAARLAEALGSPVLSHVLIRRMWRLHPGGVRAAYYYSGLVVERRGLLAAWEFLRKLRGPEDADPDALSSLLTRRAEVAMRLRDFEAAGRLVDEADRTEPGSAWVACTRARLLEAEDRCEPSLVEARRALELRPWYRPAVQHAAQMLDKLGRRGEALALLADAAGHLECGFVHAHRAQLLQDEERHREALESYDRFEELAALLSRRGRRWLAARRADLHYRLGDLERAEASARQVGNGFYTGFAERLAAKPAAAGRTTLPVPFVRQDHATCAPATLTAIARFWGRPAEHLEVAEEICYDGTPTYSFRKWAEDRGWAVRQFAVTWESAVALIDRGVPFALTTVAAMSAHMQAVMGYDALRRTFLIRDPGDPAHHEFVAEKLLKDQRAYGPVGIALVPGDRRGSFDGLDLPEAGLYDRLHALQLALAGHDRARAAALADETAALAPGGRLAIEARRALACYDSDPAGSLRCVDELLALFPDDVNLKAHKLQNLVGLTRQDERRRLLIELCAQLRPHPSLLNMLAEDLRCDAREHARTRRLLDRAIRLWPSNARAFGIAADLCWTQRRLEEGLELFRLAACIEDKDETHAMEYFRASRFLGRTDEAVRHLEERFARYGRLSGMPGRTLYQACATLDRKQQAFAHLEAAMALRPDDAELRVFAAEAYGSIGDFARADAILEQVRDRASGHAWLRTSATLACWRGELSAALELWQRVLENQPMALDAHRSVARLLAETRGIPAALEHVGAAAERFPYCYPLLQLRIEWLRDEDDAGHEQATRRLLQAFPDDVWARRELALILSERGRTAEALEEVAAAARIEPNDPGNFHVRGLVYHRAGQPEPARQCFRHAVRLFADAELSIRALLGACETAAERREALAFVRAELVRQTLFGQGLLAYRNGAQGTLEPDEILATLREALAARPDLWEAWSAMVAQLLDANWPEEARKTAREAVERFPLLPRTHLDLATACGACGAIDEQIEALRRALTMAPGWSWAARELSTALQHGGQSAEALAVLERAARHDPLDAANHGCIADLLWKRGERQAAIERVRRALVLDPDYTWAWDALGEWARQTGDPEAALAMARDLTQRRAGEARSWMVLARLPGGPERLEERLAAADRAVVLRPRDPDTHDLKAWLLGNAGRHEEALAACRPDVWPEKPPAPLRARAAWVEAQRGDRARAVELMRAALADDPGMAWGWERLADWHEAAGETDELLKALDALIRLDPRNPTLLGRRANALLAKGDRAAAKAHLRRAIQLAPDYGWGGMTLFDEQLADEELEPAAETLAALAKHVGGNYVKLREVQLELRRRDHPRAQEALRALCSAPPDETDALVAALDAWRKTGHLRPLQEVLSAAVLDPAANPEVGAAWSRNCLALGGGENRQYGRSLGALLARGTIGARAAAARAQCMAEANAPWTALWTVWRHRRLLAKDTLSWGRAGYALNRAGFHRGVVRWMSDWAGRKDAQPWMLSNLFGALQVRRLDRQAAAVCRHALTLPPDNTHPAHATWAAYYDALDGDAAAAAAAAERLKTIDADGLSQDVLFAHRLAGAVCAARSAADGGRREAFRKARAAIGTAARGCPLESRYPALRRAHRRALRAVARARGGVLALAWYVWKLLGA